MTIRAFYHPDQQLHDPQQFMRAGVIMAPQDVPARTDALIAGARAAGLAFELPSNVPHDALLAVHGPAYLAFLESAYARWRELPHAGPEVLPNTFPYWNGAPDSERRLPCPATSVIAEAGYYLGDLAVPIGPNTWHSARMSAASAIAAADAVIGSSGAAYALCRPSGHHARADRASGFCYLNNTALAATRLRDAFARVAIIDIDAHHGDGTQTIFYRRADVLTVSIHADPTTYYPFFTGYPHECGTGDGAGTNVNIPLPHKSGDEAFVAAVARAAGIVRESRVDALVVALGFDAHRDDPIGVLDVTTSGFRTAGVVLRDLALPTVLVQEGGYADAALAESLRGFLAGFAST